MLHAKGLACDGYFTGLCAVAALVGFQVQFKHVFGNNPPVLLCLAAVLLAVWHGNLRAGLSTVVASVFASAYFLMEPYHSFAVARPSEIMRLALLAGVGTLLSGVMALLRRHEAQALQRATDHAIQLQGDVARRMEIEKALVETQAQLERGVADRTTELRVAIQEIERQSRYIEAFFQHSLTPLVILDRKFNFVRVNQAYADACEKRPEDFIGRNHFDFYPSDARSIFDEVVRSRRPFHAHARPFVFPDHPDWGTTYWDWTLTPLLDHAGEVEVLFFALEDVTVRRRAELELAQYNDRLEAKVCEQTRALEQTNAQLQADIANREAAERQRFELEGRLTKIAETAPGVICSFRQTPAGAMSFPYSSPNIMEIYGIPPESLAQDAAPVFDMLPPEDVERLKSSIAESARDLAPWHDEWRVNHPVKGQIWVEGKSIPAQDADGSVLWYGFIHDITERKRVEDILRQADRRKNEFLAMLGHELRNPLTPIRNAVQILQLQPPRDSSEQWARDVIERQLGQMTRLLDDLLDVARIMNGKVTLLREPIDLNQIIDAGVESCHPLVEMRDQELVIDRANEPLWVEGDRVRLTEVLANLLNNASKYTGNGGRIELRLVSDGETALIQVKDTGIGIAPESIEPIFDLFAQAGRSLRASQGGLGIGLSLARRLVDLHGGTLSASSEGLGQGSEFRVRLPLLSAYRYVSPADTPVSGRLPSMRILVVDDFADIAQSLALLLRNHGHQVELACSGAEAIARARSFRPEVVMMDIGLPDMDGHEVARRLRERPETRDASLIAITGYGQPTDVESTSRSGFDEHLVKPVAFKDIRAALLAHASKKLQGAA